jgi:hypothetical protein
MMAGTIAVTPDNRWSAATWLFDWIVEFLASHVEEPELRSSLKEIVDENLGWLGLSDFGPKAELELRELLRTQLVDEANAKFSTTMARRDDAINYLRQLADAAS